MRSSRRSSRPTDRLSATIKTRLTPHLVNCQQRDPVPLVRLARRTRCAVRQLHIKEEGKLTISFIDRQTMRRLNRRFAQADRPTDVLSFRYRDEPIVGEILVAPAAARLYANQHRMPYQEELARYVIHGLLHWKGYQDGTMRQQRQMRVLEDKLLRQCT